MWRAWSAFSEQALRILRRIGMSQQVVVTLLNLGAVERHQGNTSAARRHYREALTTAQALQNRNGIAYALAGLAGLAGEAGDFLRSARLLGAVEALLAAIGAVLEHAERAMVDADADAARQALGEEGFAAAWEAGRVMPFDEALAEALALADKQTAAVGDA